MLDSSQTVDGKLVRVDFSALPKVPSAARLNPNRTRLSRVIASCPRRSIYVTCGARSFLGCRVLPGKGPRSWSNNLCGKRSRTTSSPSNNISTLPPAARIRSGLPPLSFERDVRFTLHKPVTTPLLRPTSLPSSTSTPTSLRNATRRMTTSTNVDIST